METQYDLIDCIIQSTLVGIQCGVMGWYIGYFEVRWVAFPCPVVMCSLARREDDKKGKEVATHLKADLRLPRIEWSPPTLTSTSAVNSSI